MDDFPINDFDNKVSRSPSSPNKAVLSVKLDFVKKTISKNVLFCLIGFTDASLENSRFVQLPIAERDLPFRACRDFLVNSVNQWTNFLAISVFLYGNYTIFLFCCQII